MGKAKRKKGSSRYTSAKMWQVKVKKKKRSNCVPLRLAGQWTPGTVILDNQLGRLKFPISAFKFLYVIPTSLVKFH